MNSVTLTWLVIGSLFCAVEVVVPTAFISVVLGISALVIAALSPLIPSVTVQVILWMVLAIALVGLAQRVQRSPVAGPARSRLLRSSLEAETLTEILPGQTGRARYEGNSWAVRCEDPVRAIAAGERVHVVGRQGNTLIVVPEVEHADLSPLPLDTAIAHPQPVAPPDPPISPQHPNSPQP